MFAVRNILFVTLGTYFFSTQLQVISGGCFGGSSAPLEDQDIHLGQILKEEENQIKYYKYAMIVYCRAVESKMEISREKITHLKELHEFNDSKWNLKFFNTRYANLINIALKVFKEYHVAILEFKKRNSLSYIQTAFYYRALQWLKFKMQIENDEENSNYRLLADAVERNLNTDVAKNYLPDILPPEYFQSEAETWNQITKTISGLQDIAKYEDAAVDLLLKIKSKGFEATELVNSEDLKKYIYEIILQRAIPENFKVEFNIEPYKMLMYADYVYSMKNENLRISEEEFKKNLKISKIPREGVMGWKFWLISFHKNVQRLFPEHVKVDETNMKLLEHFSYFDGANVLRLQCISFFYWELLPVIDKQIDDLQYSTPKLEIDRVYYARILAWLNYELSKKNYKSWTWQNLGFISNATKSKIYDSLKKITLYLEEKIRREKNENYIIKLFSLDLTENFETIGKIEDLENLRKDERPVLTLFFDYANSEEITNVAEQGLISDIKHEVIYEKMLEEANSKDFMKKFGMEPFQMLMRMDFALYSQNYSLYESQESYLKTSNVQNIPKGTLRRWKYAMIFFYRAVEINLLENEKIDGINTKLLVYLSDHYHPQNLRLSCVAFLCVHILAEIDERIQKKGVDLGGDSTQETYHEDIFKLIYPEHSGNGPQQWPSDEQRDFGIDVTFRDILNEIRASRVNAKNNNGLTNIGFGGSIISLKQKIESTLKS